jgi:hypothetical protein
MNDVTNLLDKEEIKTGAWKEIILSFHNFRVTKDLGMIFPLPKSKHKKRYVEVECILCGKKYQGQYAAFKTRDKVCKCESLKGKVQVKWSNPARDRILKIRAGMIYRCHNEKCSNYVSYGARGIYVCSEWLESQEAFYNWSLNNGYKDNLTIERINNDKGYCPENCTWAPRIAQARNKKNTLSVDKVKEIKALLNKGLSYQKIANMVGTKKGRVAYISSGKTWKNINI